MKNNFNIIIASILISCINAYSKTSPGWHEFQPEWSLQFSDFLDAIYRGDVVATRTAIDAGIAVNWKAGRYLTPLSIAALAGNDTITLLLLEHGARIHPSTLTKYAVGAKSLPILRWIDKVKPVSGFGDNGPLCHAFETSAPEVIVTFLISRTSNSTRDDPYYSSLLSKENNYTDVEKRRFLVMLLKAGLYPTEQTTINTILPIAHNSNDTTLKRLVQPLIKEKTFSTEELNYQLLKQHTVKGFDSLLDSGADPMGPTIYQCGKIAGKDMSTAFEHLRGKGCTSSDRLFVTYLRLLGHLVDRDRDRYDGQLTEQDRIFIAVATGNSDFIRQYIKKGKENAILDLMARDKHRVLSLAADAGDSSMCALLTTLKFDRKEHMYALEYAVTKGISGIVKVILNSMYEKKLQFPEENEIRQLFNTMLYHSGREKKHDIEITSNILEMAKVQNVSSRLPIEHIAVLGSSHHPALVRYLLQEQKNPFDTTAFYDIAVRNPKIFLESSVMSRVTISCTKVIDAIFPPTEDHPSSYDIEEDFRRLKKSLFILNTLCAKGINFENSLKDGWTGHIGNFLVGYDRTTQRFVPRWQIPSLFSSFGNFDDLPYGNSWYFEILTSGWEKDE